MIRPYVRVVGVRPHTELSFSCASSAQNGESLKSHSDIFRWRMRLVSENRYRLYVVPNRKETPFSTPLRSVKNDA